MTFEVDLVVPIPPKHISDFEQGREVPLEIHCRHCLFPGNKITCRWGVTNYRAEIISISKAATRPGIFEFMVKKIK